MSLETYAFTDPKPVLVTGATGCVGANIVEALLRRGHHVRAMRRATSRLDALAGLSPEWVVGDITDYASLLRAMQGCAWVFHAAAVSRHWASAPDHVYHVNVSGTRYVLRAALQQGVQRLVFTSSVAVLGLPGRTSDLLDESAVFNVHPARFHYGHSKLLAEAEVQRAIEQGLDAVIVNPASVLGQRDVNFVGGAILRVASKGLALLAPPGAMGVVSARAVGEGHVLAMERGRTGERYILNGENLRHADLLKLVVAVVGRRAPWLTLPRVALNGIAWALRRVARWNSALGPWATLVDLSARDVCFDGSKAARVLGFPSVTARAAVQEAWRWYRAQHYL